VELTLFRSILLVAIPLLGSILLPGAMLEIILLSDVKVSRGGVMAHLLRWMMKIWREIASLPNLGTERH
jgi:hypothetical protein